MSIFRFAILGAGGIAGHFCEAATLLENCEVCAVASKSKERAENFAKKNGIRSFYDSYEEMLKQEKPDCAYIAVTVNDHYRLTMLCLKYGVPALCEKAMFRCAEEARKVFQEAKEKNLFVMEALWSRFLPAVRKVKQWVMDGKIGIPEIAQCTIGFLAPEGDNRYFSPELGGGAARDITVYAYELMTFLLEQNIRNIAVSAKWSDTGVDISNHISIEFEHTLADLTASFVSKVEERMVIYGKRGKIVLPNPHFASECFLYDMEGKLTEHFVDHQTQNGFTYEMKETIRCVRSGEIESMVVPWKDTLSCASLFDLIDETKDSIC